MLIQLIYCSVASRTIDQEELSGLLQVARRNNAKNDITGMLLFAEGSFFQVLEGEEKKVELLYRRIEKDGRHHSITMIMQEPIAERSFGDWTMGYTSITSRDLDTIIGANDFLSSEESFINLGKGRAEKLLAAFKRGHWRTAISDFDTQFFKPFGVCQRTPNYSPATAKDLPYNNRYSFAFQPILNAKTKQVFSYEALLRGRRKESARQVFSSLDPSEVGRMDDQSRIFAIHLAALIVSPAKTQRVPVVCGKKASQSSKLRAISRCGRLGGRSYDQGPSGSASRVINSSQFEYNTVYCDIISIQHIVNA